MFKFGSYPRILGIYLLAVLGISLLGAPAAADGDPVIIPGTKSEVIVFEYDYFRCIVIVSKSKFTAGAATSTCVRIDKIRPSTGFFEEEPKPFRIIRP